MSTGWERYAKVPWPTIERIFMTKRIVSLLLAAVLPLILLCGCSGNRLTVREYGNELYRCWGEFLNATMEWTKYAPENYPFNGENIKGLKDTVSRRENALDDIAKINPPEKYAERHKELVKSLDYEYKWNKAALKLIDAKSAEDADKLENNIAEIVNSIPEGESLPSVYLFLYKDLKEELDG